MSSRAVQQDCQTAVHESDPERWSAGKHATLAQKWMLQPLWTGKPHSHFPAIQELRMSCMRLNTSTCCRWSGDELNAQAREYRLLMLGAVRPGERATYSELINAIEACAETEAWAADWLSGDADTVEAGVKELALQWLLHLGSPIQRNQAMSIAEMVRAPLQNQSSCNLPVGLHSA